MHIAARMDEFGRPAWIAATILAFWWFWPLGLGLVAYLVGSGRFRAWKMERRGRWHNMGANAQGCGARWRMATAPSSGNAAFDQYRAETLSRLEEEQKEFHDYLDRLRQAKDKSEFDQFMADRRRPPVPANGEPSPA